MLRRIRAILPTPWLEFQAAFWMVALLGAVLFVLGKVAVFSWLGDGLGKFLLGFGPISMLVMFGGARPIMHHPAFRDSYAGWLRLTPWNPSMPLPFAGPAWAWPDFTILFSAFALGLINEALDTHNVFKPGLLVMLYVHPYLLVSAFTLLIVRSRAIGLLMLFLYPLLFVALFWSGLSYILAFGLILLSIYGQRISFKQFPWDEKPEAKLRSEMAFEADSDQQRPSPTSIMLPVPYLISLFPLRPRRFRTSFLILTPLLFAWWTGVVAWLAKASDRITVGDEGAEMVEQLQRNGAFIVFAVAVVRILRFEIGTRSPLNIFGRIATFRFIIPSHDKKYLPSLLGLAFFMPLRDIQPFELFLTIYLIAVWLILLLPPSYESWVLTGNYRSSIRSAKVLTQNSNQPSTSLTK